MKATLVITAYGKIGEKIAYSAELHAAFDRQHRQILRRGDPDYPSDEVIEAWGDDMAAVMLNEHNTPVVFLSEIYATSECWIEEAFVRAIRTGTV
jgi:hypothetical protein